MLSLLLARAANGVIGKDNALPWRLPEDMAYFKRVTIGKSVIMGRKTWDSLPEKFRPLPGRRNIVVTRNADWHASGAERAESLAGALALCAPSDEAMLIGGAQLYAAGLAVADRIYLTEIEYAFEGDTFFPPLQAAQWHEVSRESHHKDGAPPFDYHFVVYEKKTGAS